MKRRNDLIFASIVVAVVGLLILLSVYSRRAPAMTAGAIHEGMNQSTSRESCLGCHAPDSSVRPMGPRHPKKGKPPDQMSCFACHKAPPSNKKEELASWLDQQQK
jgi:mono/diheme cytochrome c family protein